MPEPMTPDEARKKICPFMNRTSGWASSAVIRCQASDCACWGWVDGERGELDPEEMEPVEMPEGDHPKDFGHGEGWEMTGTISLNEEDKTYTRRWWRPVIKGPRRGRCEAMSPNITVEAP